MPILIILYIVLGYWATGKTILANKILIASSWMDIFAERLISGTLLGWIIIPIAIIKKILKRC